MLNLKYWIVFVLWAGKNTQSQLSSLQVYEIIWSNPQVIATSNKKQDVGKGFLSFKAKIHRSTNGSVLSLFSRRLRQECRQSPEKKCTLSCKSLVFRPFIHSQLFHQSQSFWDTYRIVEGDAPSQLSDCGQELEGQDCSGTHIFFPPIVRISCFISLWSLCWITMNSEFYLSGNAVRNTQFFQKDERKWICFWFSGRRARQKIA